MFMQSRGVLRYLEVFFELSELDQALILLYFRITRHHHGPLLDSQIDRSTVDPS